MDVVLGTMTISGSFNGLMVLDRNAIHAAAVLQLMYDCGVRTIDTAPIYARGHAESDVGQFTRTHADVSVWTKAGVDISAPLPRLDYTVEGIAESFRCSAQRLAGARVTTVFLHNPPADIVRAFNFGSLSRALPSATPMDLGVSIRVGCDIRAVLESSLPTGAPVMAELSHLSSASSSDVQELSQRYAVIVRSIFGGGGELKRTLPVDRPAIVEDRLLWISENIAPRAVVIAPRTAEQAETYATAIGDIHAPR